jgi:hypothetical protein
MEPANGPTIIDLERLREMTTTGQKSLEPGFGPTRSLLEADRVFSFDSWCLIPSRRLLFDGETPVGIGSRAPGNPDHPR